MAISGQQARSVHLYFNVEKPQTVTARENRKRRKCQAPKAVPYDTIRLLARHLEVRT